jgi:hypothetical protein
MIPELIALAIGVLGGVLLGAALQAIATRAAEDDARHWRDVWARADGAFRESRQALELFSESLPRSPLRDFLRRAEPEFQKLREQAQAADGCGSA